MADEWTSDQHMARGALARFTPENPLIVGPIVYAAMKVEPAFADMMDRVKMVEGISHDQ